MSTQLGNAVLELTTDNSKLHKGLQEGEKEASGFGSRIGGIAKGALLGIAGIGIGVGAALLGAAHEAAQEEVGIFRLAQAVKNAGGDWDELRGHIEDVIHTQELQTAFSDNEQRDALSMLIALTGDYDTGLARLPIAMDLARGANIDLVTASRLLGKTSDENTTALARMGIKLKDNATAQDVLNAVTEKFGGQAAAFAGTTAGQMQIVQNEFSNLTEQVGAMVLPMISQLLKGVLGVIEGLRTFAAQPEVIAFVSTIADVFGRLAGILGEVFGVITGSAPAAGAILSNAIGSGPAKLIMGYFATIRDVAKAIFSGDLQGIFTALKTHVGQMLTDLLGIVGTAGPALGDQLLKWGKEFVAWVGPASIAMLKELLALAGEGIHWIQAHAKDIGNALADWGGKFAEFIFTVAIPQLITTLPEILATIAHWILFDAAPALAGAMWDLGSTMVGRLADALGSAAHDIWESIVYMLRQAFNMINFWVGPFHVTAQGISVSMPQLSFPGFEQGGTITRTGLALVHAGETITPASGTPAGGPITVNSRLVVDGRELAFAQATYQNDQGRRAGIAS